jgi:hypothetical protein
LPPLSTSRLRALGVALTGALVLGAAPGTAAAAPSDDAASLSRQVASLNAEVDRAAVELADEASAYEAAAQELARLTQAQFAAGAAHDAMRDAAADSRSVLAGLARSAYKGGMPPAVTALLAGDPRALADLAYVQKSIGRLGVSRAELARGLAEQQAGAGEALEQSDELRRAALAQRRELDDRLAGLVAKGDRLTAELSAAAARLDQARAVERAAALASEQRRARAAAESQAQAISARMVVQIQATERARAAAAAAAAGSGAWPDWTGTAATSGGAGGCQPPSPYGEANGFLSDGGLCPLPTGGGHRLRTDAALAFDALNAARQAATGAPLCVTDSYRSFPAQVRVFRDKPGLAATPGRSQHGWGLAVDLCGGVQNFGSEAHLWMLANAPLYGWVHPAWARQGSSRPEAWHWEYVGR